MQLMLTYINLIFNNFMNLEFILRYINISVKHCMNWEYLKKEGNFTLIFNITENLLFLYFMYSY